MTRPHTPPPALITVVICTYNRVRLLPRAIESLRHQTIAEWECLIVDDGSTDTTREYAASLMDVDRRFRYVYQPNSGLSAARNTGLQHSAAPWVTFLDSDDEYAPEHLESRLAFLHQHPDTDLLYGGVKIVGGPDFVPDLHDPRRSIPLSQCYIGGTFVLRRTAAGQLGGFQRPDYGNDYALAQRALHSHVVRRIDAPTYIYHREEPDSMCNLMEKSCQKDIGR